MLTVDVLQTRRISGAALLWTLGVLLFTLTRTHPELEWLERDYGLLRWHFVAFYGGVLAVLTVVSAFEPAIREELRGAHATGVLVLIALCVAMAAPLILRPEQPWRLFRPVPILSTAILYVVVLSGLTVLLPLKNPLEPATPRMRRYTWIVLGILGIALITAHIVSVGRFVQLNDTFDEFYASAISTSFAESGRFSSSFANFAYGDRDPSMPGYYYLLGYWIRLTGSSTLFTLRSFQMIVGSVALALIALMLWREPTFTPLQRTAGLVMVLGMNAFARTAHNMRMDIGLAVYGTLAMICYLIYLRDTTQPRRILFLMGLVLYLGLETTTLPAFLFGLSLGTMLVVREARSGGWGRIFAYAGGAAIACGVFLLVHFAPDFAGQLEEMQAFRDIYNATNSTAFGFPLRLIDDTWRYSFVLSPLEPALIYTVFALGMIFGTPRDRWVLVPSILTLLLIWTFLGVSFGYNALFLAATAYAAARLFQTRLAVLVGGLVLLPAMVAAPLYDMINDTRNNLNARLITELDLLTWQVPEGGVVVGDDRFWITLHDQTHYIGDSGIKYYAGRYNLDRQDFLEAVEADAVVCHEEQTATLCQMADNYFTSDPTEFVITAGRFWLYQD